MKNIIKIITISLLTLLLFACNKDNSDNSQEEVFGKDASYALGMNEAMYIEEYMASSGITMDVDEFIQGIKDYLTSGKTRLTVDEAIEKLETAFNAVFENLTSEEAQKEVTFLAENSKNPGVMITASGLQYEIISEGEGPKPSYFDTVKVHYSGIFTDGTLFDSSYEYGEPIEFPLYAVIPGWAEGLQLMNVGSTYRFYIPSELGYGPNGIQNIIPPYATLVFEVVLLDIVDEEHT
jgi:FKBP-type peptidyl-prolyl cis-trans isomerase FkpA